MVYAGIPAIIVTNCLNISAWLLSQLHSAVKTLKVVVRDYQQMYTKMFFVAARVFYIQYPGSFFSTLPFSKSNLCWWSHACTAIPLFVSPILTGALCSTSLLFVLTVSPMYDMLQSIQDSIHGSVRERALESAALRPRMWVRYNMFVLWPHKDNEVETFHWHLNSQFSDSQRLMPAGVLVHQHTQIEC